MLKYDFVIIGSGLYGVTFNYMAKQHGRSCLIIERIQHVGGNIYTPIIYNLPFNMNTFLKMINAINTFNEITENE